MLGWFAIASACLLLPLVLIGIGLLAWLRRSLPKLDGSIHVDGLLGSPLTIGRDAQGVPTIRASTLDDAAYGLGFAHAQDRLFQMESLRRYASGRLSELFGPGDDGMLLNLDRRIRGLGLREVALRAVENLPPSQQSRLRSYVAGVNAGIKSLRSYPFEFSLLRSKPDAWAPADSMLVVLVLYLDLQGDNLQLESVVGLVHDLLPRELAEFLTPRENPDWDAPLYGEPAASSPIPGRDVFDLRGNSSPPRDTTKLDKLEQLVAGSNAWAVAGSRSEHGGAILANDMHLPLRLPNTWYRAKMEWGDGGERSAVGVSIPGGPGIVVGSNGDVAWGFTNTQADWSDLILLELDPEDPRRYRTPDGWATLETAEERIRVRGQSDVLSTVERTIWGPVLDTDHLGRKRVLRWTALDTEGLHLGIVELAESTGLTDLLDRANLGGVPHLNCIAADRAGNIGWTIMGRIPNRVGFDGRVPVSWADGSKRWDGYAAPEDNPRVLTPPGGFVWNANGRSVLGPDLARLGDGPYDRGARGKQIRDALRTMERATERDMLNLQRDNRALFMARWRDLMARTLDASACNGNAGRARIAREIEAWDGLATADSKGYALVREFRLRAVRDALSPLLAPCRSADPRFQLADLKTIEGPAWALVNERPPHLLDPRFSTWDEFLLSLIDEMIADMPESSQLRTWGQTNTLAIKHPLSAALPFIGRFLNMPTMSMGGGWTDMPFIQGPEFGASERLVVSPGREDRGIFHMPGGQSGHPLSPAYRAGHDAWVRGLATPLLPCETVHTLRLNPAGRP